MSKDQASWPVAQWVDMALEGGDVPSGDAPEEAFVPSGDDNSGGGTIILIIGLKASHG